MTHTHEWICVHAQALFLSHMNTQFILVIMPLLVLYLLSTPEEFFPQQISLISLSLSLSDSLSLLLSPPLSVCVFLFLSLSVDKKTLWETLCVCGGAGHGSGYMCMHAGNPMYFVKVVHGVKWYSVFSDTSGILIFRIYIWKFYHLIIL